MMKKSIAAFTIRRRYGVRNHAVTKQMLSRQTNQNPRFFGFKPERAVQREKSTIEARGEPCFLKWESFCFVFVSIDIPILRMIVLT